MPNHSPGLNVAAEESAKAIKKKVDDDREVEKQREKEREDALKKRLKEVVDDDDYPIHPDAVEGGGGLPPVLAAITRDLMDENNELHARLRKAEIEREFLLREFANGL